MSTTTSQSNGTQYLRRDNNVADETRRRSPIRDLLTPLPWRPRRFLLTLLALVLTGILGGESTSNVSGWQTATALPTTSGTPSAAETLVARGRVFVDRDSDNRWSPGDSLFAGVRVSNGHDIVRTNERGEYEIPVTEEGVVFVVKPTGFSSPLNRDNLPNFYYLHRPQGSPQLKFPGVAPTGPLPQSIDFPLRPQTEVKNFQVLLFGDPQPRNLKEVDYIAQDVVREWIGTSAAFGVTLGDICFDDLSLFEPLNQTIALIGIPWHNVIGNHDVNTDATRREVINDTFERVYGPSYYSFDYGQVHFLVLDNIDWEQKADGRWGFRPGFGAEQLAFIERDLALIPESQMVVLFMHCPIMQAVDREALYRLIEKRPLCLSISAHQHTHQHHFLGPDDGWQGRQPHHHIVNVTVSGSWWSGKKDERGIPHTMMADGAPNGASLLTFDGSSYRLDFFPAGLERGQAMRIALPVAMKASETENFPLFVNVFNGSERSQVRCRWDLSNEWQTLTQTRESDPVFQALFDDEVLNPNSNEPKLAKPAVSTHLWRGVIPSLTPGLHLLEVETTDMHGRVYRSQKSVRISAE